MKTATGSPSSLPTRIIEIDESHLVRLKQSAPDEKAHYACLSYCWGKNPERQLQTTQRTLAEFERGLQWPLLPKTFQDALALIRKLGLKYLWIDSLCILQDDPEDWRTEGSKMATIYENSYITIAATNSAGPHDGLCSPVPEDDLYVVRTPEEHFKLHVRDGDTAPYYGSMPLAKRAWAFQEHVLAPRVVHFAKDELFWEDGQMISCECNGLNDNDQWNPFKGYYVKPHHLAGADTEERSFWWHEVVTTYSGLQLTFESDIFPALQGITHVMQQSKNCEYYAGLWEDSFIQDMLWFCPEPNLRPFAFRAPTWSWASVVGKVEYFTRYVQKICASVQSVTVTPVGSSPLGQVCEASVTIRGPALIASISPPKIDDTIYSSPSMSLKTGEGLTMVEGAGSAWFWDDKNGKNSGEMLIMHMGSESDDSFEGASIFVIFKSVGGGGGVYERVGLSYSHVYVAQRRLVFEEMEITVV